MLFPPRINSVFALACVLALAACGSGTDLPRVASVSVTPGTNNLTSLGETAQLSATAQKASGGTVSSASFTWNSSAPAVASVSATGLVTAVGNGSATITATEEGGTSGSASVTVAQEAETIAVSLAHDTITLGETTQGSATAEDGGGSEIDSPSFAWASSDPAVATVDATGLVTGLAEGAVSISASLNGTSGSDSLVVVRPDLTLAADTTMGGSVEIGDLTIAEGVTVTLSDDLELDVNGTLSIVGILTGDCRSIEVEGDGFVAISGTVNNVCTSGELAGDGAPSIYIDAPGGVDLTDGTLVSSGPITISSEPSSQLLRVAASEEGGSSPASGSLGTISLVGATVRADPAEAPQPGSASDPEPDGADFNFAASVDLILDGTTMEAQHGGPGVPASETSSTDLTVSAGHGGDGGDIVLALPEGAYLHFGTTRGRTRLIAGDGGPGGPATATATENPAVDPAPSAMAKGGDGGEGGSVQISSTAYLSGDLGLFERQVGLGGRGGNATAFGAPGVDATATREAQAGGPATAQAGSGTMAGKAEGSWEGMPAPDGKTGGGGGIARATGGDGGDGIRSRPDGALGGETRAWGGYGGRSTGVSGGIGGDAVADGGNGGSGADVCSAFTENALTGQISVFSDPAYSDPYIFGAGAGIGLSLAFRVLSTVAGPGGAGGGGAIVSARPGFGGWGHDEVRAADGVGSVGPGGNGGDGGAGIPGGDGGLAGGLGMEPDPLPQETNPVFQTGSDGGSCGAPGVAGPLLVLPAEEGDQTIELNGSGPWVDVTGTLAQDGTVTGTGRGTVAGVPNILVEFSGSWDETTKTLQGTYTIDSEKVISAGHPVVYSVTVSGG